MHSLPEGRKFMPLVVAVLFVSLAHAGGLRITIPKRSKPTPVQKLNREGVKEIQHHHLARAERLFYRAYLIDPDDPFTLNNLGYISELQGKIDRAQHYYQLAAKENNSETVIAMASARNLEGKKLSDVTEAYGNLELRVNRGNIEAMSLLEKGRSQEAEDILRNTLKLDPRNPFTLNNLGYKWRSKETWTQPCVSTTMLRSLIPPNQSWFRLIRSGGESRSATSPSRMSRQSAR